MYFYPAAKQHHVTRTIAFFLTLLCAVWLGTGLVGHDPWKPDEAYGFGLVYSMLQSGDWLVPMLAGEPFLEKPPLFYWTAALFAKIFSFTLAPHDGARLASGFYTGLTLLFTGLAGRELFGKHQGWASAVILIGCLGMLVRAHELITDLALLTGCAMMLYGYSLCHRRPPLAGILIGIGVGVGFMSKGFIAPIFFLLISASLLLFPAWRTREFRNTLLIATPCALPWLGIWPWLLYQRSPELFAQWAWHSNIGNWLNYARAVDYSNSFEYVKVLPWLAWPALPLAAWAVWEARKKIWQHTEFQLLITSFLVMLITLSFIPNIQEVFALPMLLPLALLATGALSTLRRGAANALDWFGIMTFALIAILLWWGWTGLLVDSPAKITYWLKEYQPGYNAEFHSTPFWIAVTSTVLWVVLVWRTGRSIHRSVINWAGGVTLLWVLLMTLWLPWLETGKSYRGMVHSLHKAIPRPHGCIAGENIGISERAMLHYFADIRPRMGAQTECEYLIVEEGHIEAPDLNEKKWRKLWEGRRTGDKHERFKLYRKISK